MPRKVNAAMSLGPLEDEVLAEPSNRVPVEPA
jgi:hypothetical protein